MALILSSDIEDVKVQVFGNWFTFKAGQIKVMDDRISHELCTSKSYLGFVGLPDSVIEDPASDESKKAKETATKEGRGNIARHLTKVINNLEVSLQKDLDVSGMKIHALKLASEGELKAYKKLAEFKHQEVDESERRLNEITKLKEQINGSAKSANPRPSN